MNIPTTLVYVWLYTKLNVEMPQLHNIFGRPLRRTSGKFEPPSHKYPDIQASHQLAKAFLSYRTAVGMIDDCIRAIKVTQGWIQWNTVHGCYEEHLSYTDTLDVREKELKKCKIMLREGEFGLV